jgi:type IV pilus assembly protein PilM
MAQRIVGLDIGTSAVRAVELTLDAGPKPVLEAFGQVGMGPGVVVDGEIRDRSQVVQALKRLWSEGGFKERKVVVGIAGLRAITREVDMPPLPPEEMDDAVRFQADQVVPFPMDQTAMSSQVIAQYTDADGAPQVRVLVAAAHLELIHGVVDAVREAGLEPVGIDLDTAALARALHDPEFTEGAEVIVSVGAGLTMVVVHEGGLLQFVRTIDLAGESVTQAIASSLDLPMVDAEEIKRSLDDPEVHDARAESAVATVVAELVGEIHNSIRFFASQPGRTTPVRLLVTGSGAQTAGFMTKLQQGIDIPVLPASPLSRVDISRLPISPEQAAAIDPTLAVPVGLALPDPGGKPFNLLPTQVTIEYTQRRVRRVLVTCGVVLFLLVAGGTVWRILAVQGAEHQVSTLNAELTKINKTEIPKYDKVVALQSKVKGLQMQLEPLVSGEVDWLVVLNQLGQYLPSSAVFSTVELTASSTPGSPAAATASSSKNKTASAAATLGTGTAEVVVPNLTTFSQFGHSMGQSPAFTLGPPTGSLDTTGSVTFDITFGIGQEAGSQRVSRFTKVVP